MTELADRTVTRRGLLATAGALTLAGGLAACGGSGSSASSAPTSGARPKRGGNFRVALPGGSSTETINAHYVLTKGDEARLVATFETLVEYDDHYRLAYTGLAEEVTQDSPTQWTIRLRPGIEFQNGKTLAAEDVAYSLRQIIDPKSGAAGGPALSSLDPNGMKAMDSRTLRLSLRRPDSTIADQLAQYYNGIAPTGYKPWPSAQIGTGAFKVRSFTPGQQSVHIRNPNYWRTGQPYFDTVTIVDFPDPSAQVNAFLSGQVDATTDVPPGDISALKAREAGVLVSKTGGWIPLCMAVDMPPFNDNRVRQAMRLLVDRQQIVEQVFSGYATIGNDLYSPFDQCYDSELPQRTQDIGKAQSLLKQAGQEGLSIDLHTTNGAAGMVDTANVFAAQAKAAGVNITVHNDPSYYGNQYLKLGFSVDFWLTHNYLPQTASGMLKGSPFNETHWPPSSGPGSNYPSLFDQALAETDASKRCEIIHEMQMTEYNYGGYIIPFFNDLVDGYSKKVQGLRPSKAVLNLNAYGHGFRTIWFA